MKSVTLADHFSATISLRIAEPQPHYGLVQLNAQRGASNELISCDVKRAEFIDALRDVLGLVVIDPEDREVVRRVMDAYSEVASAGLYSTAPKVSVEQMQAALRSLLAPPKPQEPTGLGAVVEDAGGVRWTRVESTDLTRNPWYPADDADKQPAEYHTIDAARVLSEGVQR